MMAGVGAAQLQARNVAVVPSMIPVRKREQESSSQHGLSLSGLFILKKNIIYIL